MNTRSTKLFRKFLCGIVLTAFILSPRFGPDSGVRAHAGPAALLLNPIYLPLVIKGYPPPADQMLTVKKSGSGSGSVTSDPPGIDCGSTCSASYTYNTSVTLTALAVADSTFDGWKGSGCSGIGTCTVSMDAARSVTATFSLGTYLLRVGTTGLGSGMITSAPAGIACPEDCFYSYTYGTQVTLTATPSSPSTFGGWYGDVCSGTDPCVITMNADKQVSASFLLLCSGVANCDFENVTNVGWVSFSSSNDPMIYNCTPPDYAECNYISPHSGVHLAWLGGVNADKGLTNISSIAQQVSIVSSAPHLVYWQWIESEDPCTSGCDYAQVFINGMEVDKYNLTSDPETERWIAHSIDLSAYGGKSVSLKIQVTTDDSNISNLYIDDVSLQASP